MEEWDQTQETRPSQCPTMLTIETQTTDTPEVTLVDSTATERSKSRFINALIP